MGPQWWDLNGGTPIMGPQWWDPKRWGDPKWDPNGETLNGGKAPNGTPIMGSQWWDPKWWDPKNETPMVGP